MALPGTIDWLADSALGDDANGGGQVRSVDFSRISGAPLYTGTQGAGSSADNNFVDGTANFVDDETTVDLILNIISGTGALVGRYHVVSRTNNTTLVLDRPCGSIPTGTDLVYRLGGALAGPQLALAASVANHIVHWKRGESGAVYTISTTSNNVSGGKITLSAEVSVIGFENTPYDWGEGPTFKVADSGVTSITMVTCSNATNRRAFANVTLDGNAKTSIRALDTGNNQCLTYRCTFINLTNGGAVGATMVVLCDFVNAGSSSTPACSNNVIVAFCSFSGSGRFISCNRGAFIFNTFHHDAGSLAARIIDNAQGDAFIAFNTIKSTPGSGFDGIGHSVRCSVAINNVVVGMTTGNASSTGATNASPALQIVHQMMSFGNAGVITAGHTNPLMAIFDSILPTNNPLASGEYGLNSDPLGGELGKLAGFGTIGDEVGTPDVGAVQSEGGNVIVIDD